MNNLNLCNYYLAGSVKEKVEARLTKWKEQNIAERIWKHDPAVWKEKPEDDKELSNRLGWLNLASSMKDSVKEITDFANEVKSEFSSVVLLGMGGSSLAPEVFAKTFGGAQGYPALVILDSTHPYSVKKILETHDMAKTLFVVSSKSGGTIETMSFFHTFFDAVKKVSPAPGKNFIALTDPGSGLEKMAKENGFRKIFSTPAEVGGRFSALTPFGMVPAALIGMDIASFLNEAALMTEACSAGCDVANSPGFYFGALLGELALNNINKVTVFASPEISSFPAWAEQLVAESTGKDGVGILPVADERFEGVDKYGKDRVFVSIELKDGNNSVNLDAKNQLIKAGYPVIEMILKDKYALAQEFFRWEVATAMAGAVLEINPFDQPNVQLAKTLAGESLAAYKANGSLPVSAPVITGEKVEVYSPAGAATAKGALEEFLSQAAEGNYAAINCFAPMTEEAQAVLTKLRIGIRNKYKIATTLGFGPRFLHSTGQLHKGDGNKGLFIVITSDPGNDIDVPGQGYSFGTLIAAQGQGDIKALVNCKRRTLHLHLKGDIIKAVEELL